MSEHFGFEEAQEVIALVGLAVFLVYLISTAYDWRREKEQRIEGQTDGLAEASSLLKDH